MTIEKSVLVPLDADQTFALITEPERMRRWFAVTLRMELRAGGDYRWTVVPGQHASGTFTEVEPGKRVVFTWGWEGSDVVPPGASTVTITLEPCDGGTQVTLEHSGLPDEDQEKGHEGGWTEFLSRLARAGRDGDAGYNNWGPQGDIYDNLSAAEASLSLCQWALRDLTAADMTAQTPCAKYDVRQLADHLMGSIVGLAGMVGVTVVPAESGTLEERIADAAQPLMEGWNRRGIDGMVAFGAGELPAETATRIITLEFLVHAWDFAAATGRTLPQNEALAAFALEQARGLVPGLRDGERFGDEVFVGPDADAITKLVALTGRSV
jgi:uncharacterized protein (TIGR03086 family)